MPVDDASPVPTVIGGAGRTARPTHGGPEGTSRTVRVALLEQGPLRSGTAAMLRATAPDLDVVVAATTWLELVHSPAFPTDLVLIDARLREAVSIESRIRTCRAAGAKVVVLIGEDDGDVRDRALRAGAAAVVRSCSGEEVLAVARTVMRPPARGEERDWRPLPQGAERLEPARLSLGEEEALRLYASGRSTQEVATAMHVRFETAKTYLRRVREKYARVGRPASRRAELVERATEDGYI